MNYFQHHQAIVETKNIGKGTRIWAFSHILPGATIGEECNICDHTFIENDVQIGDRVTIKCGVQLWDGIRIKADVFIGPNVTFTNDPFPRSKQYPGKFSETTVCNGASIGANATILPGLEIGRGAMVGAGSVVTRNVPPNAIVVGNPARIKGYTTTRALEVNLPLTIQEHPGKVGVGDVQIIPLPLVKDLRGDLTVAEFQDQLPFIIKRVFFVFDVKSQHVRGEHAHKTLQQFLICIGGSLSVVVDDGKNRAEIVMDKPNIGVYIPPMVWATQFKHSEDAVLVVLASDIYQGDDYIRDYDEFIQMVENAK